MTAVKHLDFEAPALVQGLFAQDDSGLWSRKPVQCASGNYAMGDYARWRSAAEKLASGVVSYDNWPAEWTARVGRDAAG